MASLPLSLFTTNRPGWRHTILTRPCRFLLAANVQLLDLWIFADTVLTVTFAEQYFPQTHRVNLLPDTETCHVSGQIPWIIRSGLMLRSQGAQ